MKELVLHARPSTVLNEDGKLIGPHQPFIVSEDRALELLTDPRLDIREVDSSGLNGLTRGELNSLAAGQGIADAEALPNKQAVIDAIEGRENEPDTGQEEIQ